MSNLTVCLNNHPREYVSNIQIKQVSQQKNIAISCQSCQTTFDKLNCGSFRCHTCNQDICENCCISRALSQPCCQQGHPLQILDLTNQILQKLYGNFKCTKCLFPLVEENSVVKQQLFVEPQQSQKEPFFARCFLCNLDVCSNCFREENPVQYYQLLQTGKIPQKTLSFSQQQNFQKTPNNQNLGLFSTNQQKQQQQQNQSLFQQTNNNNNPIEGQQNRSIWNTFSGNNNNSNIFGTSNIDNNNNNTFFGNSNQQQFGNSSIFGINQQQQQLTFQQEQQQSQLEGSLFNSNNQNSTALFGNNNNNSNYNFTTKSNKPEGLWLLQNNPNYYQSAKPIKEKAPDENIIPRK